MLNSGLRQERASADGRGIREFTGSSMPNILAQIRSAFGKDAIILDKQRVNGRLVVMACGEQDLAMDAQGMELVLGPVPEAGRDSVPLRTSQVRDSTRGGRASSLSQPGAAAAILEQLGFGTALIQVVQRGDASLSLGQRLAEALLPPLTADDEAGIRAWRFSGLAGHGKTTMIARLIADAAARGSAGELRVVSTDAARLGATWRLEKLAELAGVPFRQASERTLDGLVREATGRVLIDTDGSTAGARIRSRAAASGPRIADVVVVSAAASAGVVRRVLDDAPAGARIALTQLDLTDQPGESLTAIWREIRNGKRLRWFAYGQDLDGSHQPANVSNLAQWLDTAIAAAAN
ncbi:MAG: hypothetical protein H6993_12425 [Pseudomonadales bacterium]|nr:hypothetical protein [Pseudomonadales bacterium]MCP5184764.1 hypothetical protein [Pseudomonadales bacterium]